jgi:hypothetical protein
VIDGRVVLVDRLLYETQPEHPRVEVDVARGVAGDGGDVMDAFELHVPKDIAEPAADLSATVATGRGHAATEPGE